MIKLGAAGDGESDQKVFGVLLVMVLGAAPVAVFVKFVYEYAPALCMACGGAKSEPDGADKGDEVDMGMKPEEHAGEEEAKQGGVSLGSKARLMDRSVALVAPSRASCPFNLGDIVEVRDAGEEWRLGTVQAFEDDEEAGVIRPKVKVADFDSHFTWDEVRTPSRAPSQNLSGAMNRDPLGTSLDA